MGTQQSGMLEFVIANLRQDVDIIKAARHAVDELLIHDPALEKVDNKPLRQALYLSQQGKSIWKYIG